jgi:hypothetical protein
VVVRGTGGVESSLNILPGLRTVESLFTEAERQICSGADEVRVVFDSRFGYPSRMFVDLEDSRADDEWVWTAALTPVE